MSILLRFEVQMSLNFQTFKEKVHSTFTEINSKQRKATQSNRISETLMREYRATMAEENLHHSGPV